MGINARQMSLKILGMTCLLWALGSIGCGESESMYPVSGDSDDISGGDTHAHSRTLNRLPRESLRPLPQVDEKGYPLDPTRKTREVRFVTPTPAYEDANDDPRFVRETGFRPVSEYEDDDDPRFVRETGFLPAPIIRLIDVTDDVATIAWNPVPGAGYYLIEGVQFSMDGAPANSFDARSRETRHALDTDGDLTVITVVAVSPNGKDRSAQSNKLTVTPIDP